MVGVVNFTIEYFEHRYHNITMARLLCQNYHRQPNFLQFIYVITCKMFYVYYFRFLLFANSLIKLKFNFRDISELKCTKIHESRAASGLQMRSKILLSI